MKGKLYLIPGLLGEDNTTKDIPEYNKSVIKTIKHFIVEEVRTARRFLKKMDSSINIDELTFHTLNEHTKSTEIASYLDATEENNIGLLSEAGVPCVADPGSVIVKLAHQKGIRVIPLTGPSSILLALMASGLNGQNFAFNGYLPVQKQERIKSIKALERRSFTENQTQIFIETPYRNNQLIDDIIDNCELSTMFCIACDLTLESEMILTLSVSEWKNKKPDLHKRPAIFLIKK